MDAQMYSACIWATERINGCLPVLISYEADATPIPTSYFSIIGRIMNPITWWKWIPKWNSFAIEPAFELAKLAMLYYQVKTAQLPLKVFSNFGFIYS